MNSLLFIQNLGYPNNPAILLCQSSSCLTSLLQMPSGKLCGDGSSSNILGLASVIVSHGLKSSLIIILLLLQSLTFSQTSILTLIR